MSHIRLFKDIGRHDAAIAGGKGASLGEMTQAGIPVPPGFIVLSDAFERFLEETDLGAEVDSILHTVHKQEMHTVEHASEKIQQLILDAQMPADIGEEIKKYFKELDTEFVAVRSSATAEDSASAAWAGQLESYLNTTEETLLKKVQRCWASLFTPRAIFYRFEKGLHAQKISVAVVVQKMIESEVSGIAFSVHPVTEDHNQLIIEAGYGLGEAIVGGQVTPDSYVVEKEPRRIIDTNVSTQTRALYRAEGGGNEWKEIPEPKASAQVLTAEQVLELAELIIRIEQHYGFPCDIEWAYEKEKFYITQSRPITTLTPIQEQPKQQHELSFSRECNVFTLELWFEAENKRITHYTDLPLPSEGYMYFEYENGLAKNFIDMSFVRRMYDHALKKTLSDSTYFSRIEQTFWDLYEKIKPYLNDEKKISDIDSLKYYYENASEIWAAYTIPYWLSYLENKDLPKDLFERSKKIRLAIETILDDTSRISSHALKNIFKDTYSPLLEYATATEIFTNTIPSENVLEERSKSLLYKGKITLTRPKVTLLKSFSRPHTLYYTHLWRDSNTKNAKRWLGRNIEEALYVRPGTEETVDVWYSQREFDLYHQGIREKIKNDPQWFPALVEYHNNEWKRVLSYIHKESPLTKEEFRDFTDHWLNWWEPMAIFMQIPEITDLPQKIRDEAFKLRAETQEYSDRGDEMYLPYIRAVHPELEKYHGVLTPEEVVSAQFPSTEILEKRLKGWLLTNEKFANIEDLPQEMERRGFVFESRDITVKELIGQTAYKGVVRGTAKIVRRKTDMEKVAVGDVLVAPMTTPDFMPAMERAAAFVTDEGGVTCHAAIIAREMQKPCVIGTRVATQVLKDGDMVEVDANTGIIRRL